MNPETLAPWRDIALVLLCLEAAILVAIPGVILFFAQKYLRRFRHWLRLPLLRIQVYALRVEHLTLRASNAIADVPITLQVLGARARASARRIVNRG